MVSTWWTFVQDGLDKRNWKPANLANAAGYDASVLTGWKKGATPRPEQIRLTADALGLKYIDGLIAAGIIETTDLDVEPTVNLDKFTDAEVLNEAAKRAQNIMAGQTPTR